VRPSAATTLNRAAGPDAGKADVFIDDMLQETVDCFFAGCPLEYQFAGMRCSRGPPASR
jgi:hypothetical protein